MKIEYTPWRFRFAFQRPNRGSKGNGNFAIGITADRHPRFRHYFICLWWIELGVCWDREFVE